MHRLASKLVAVFSFLVLIICSGFVLSSGNDKNLEDVQSDSVIQADFFVTYEEASVLPWEKEDVTYLFLPSYFDLQKTELRIPEGSLYVDGEKLEDRETLGFLEKDKLYPYQLLLSEKALEGKLMILQSANIGTVFVATDSGSMEQVDSDKEYREGGSVLVKEAGGATSYMGLLKFIRSRGNATWQTEKKSYSMKLLDEADLLQMGSGQDWVLLCNVFDGSKLQNKICLDMAEGLGLAYTSQNEWVDLYLNGQYRGNYLLCEQIEVGENRVEITDLEEQTKRLNRELAAAEPFDTGTRRAFWRRIIRKISAAGISLRETGITIRSADLSQRMKIYFLFSFRNTQRKNRWIILRIMYRKSKT